MLTRSVARGVNRIMVGAQIGLSWLHAGWIAGLLAIATEFGIDILHSIFGFLSERQWVLAHRYVRMACLFGMFVCIMVAAYHFGECLHESLSWHPVLAHGCSLTLHAIITKVLEFPKEL